MADLRVLIPIRTGMINILVALTSYTLWTVSTGKRSILKRIMWANRTGANGYLRIGYIDNTPAFVPVLPDILMLGGPCIEDVMDVPLCGNSPEGFCLDATVGAGSTGLIVIQCTVGGADPAQVQISGVVEEI